MDSTLGLTVAWAEEFLTWPTREQTTLAAAVHTSGVVPLAAPMTLLSLDRIKVRFGLEAMFLHEGGVS